MTISGLLSLLRAQAGLAMPKRIIAGDLKDFRERDQRDLEQGVVTLLLGEEEAVDQWSSTLVLTVVGQLNVREREHSKVDLEQAEIALRDEIRAFLRNPGADVPHISISQIRYSSQMEFPFGYVAIAARCGPFDESDLDPAVTYPPNVRISELTRLKMDIDIPPVASDAVHAQWLQGDYSGGRPDSETEVEFPQ